MNIKLAALLALVLVGVLIIMSLVRRDANPGSALSLEDLLLGDDGKMSKAAAVMLGAFVVTTWMMVWLTLRDKMTEMYLSAYLTAWVAPTVTKLIVGADAGAKSKPQMPSS